MQREGKKDCNFLVIKTMVMVRGMIGAKGEDMECTKAWYRSIGYLAKPQRTTVGKHSLNNSSNEKTCFWSSWTHSNIFCLCLVFIDHFGYSSFVVVGAPNANSIRLKTNHRHRYLSETSFSEKQKANQHRCMRHYRLRVNCITSCNWYLLFSNSTFKSMLTFCLLVAIPIRNDSVV